MDGERAEFGYKRGRYMSTRPIEETQPPAVKGERASARSADATIRAPHEHHCVLRPQAVPQVRTVAPHVNPAPTAPSTTVSPSAIRPSLRARSSAIGMLAAEVLPTSAMTSSTR